MLTLKNEFIFAPVKTGYSDDSGIIKQKHLDFYHERSKEVAAVTPEPFYLDKGLREIPTQIGIDSDNKVEGLRKLTQTIHRNGAKAIAHLNHAGRMANPNIPGNYHISPTSKPCENGGATPRRMEEQDFRDVKKLFYDAAYRSKEAGFDIIELQFGHGYLLAQFLSPFVNDRLDNYGGSFENRVRFPLEILDEVKKAGLPIIARISGDDMVPGGITIDEMQKFSGLLEEKGIEAVHVSAGTVCTTPPWYFQHMFTAKGKTWEFASKIKEIVNIPVIAVGRINSRHDVDKLKRNHNIDYLALGRALVADPYFIGKYKDPSMGNIRPCLACSEGCLGGVKSGNGIRCVVNPEVGNTKNGQQPVTQSRHFAVVGGGLAGMEVALTLKERGHEVTLYEKEQLGGQFNIASLPPNKEGLKEIVDYFTGEIEKNQVTIKRETFDSSEVENQNYEGVVLATGAKPMIPYIKGLKEYFWAEFLLDENLPENQKILIIGGGLIGVEIASKLLEKNNEVILVEMLNQLARGMETIERKLTLRKLMNNPNVRIFKEYAVTEVNGRKVKLSGNDKEVIEEADNIVVAAGMQSNNPLEKELKDKVDTWVIGDAKKVGKAQDAILSGYNLGKRL